MVGELGNFGWFKELSQVWGEYERSGEMLGRNGEVCWGVGEVSRMWGSRLCGRCKSLYGVSVEVVEKCVGMWRSVWKDVGRAHCQISLTIKNTKPPCKFHKKNFTTKIKNWQHNI